MNQREEKGKQTQSTEEMMEDHFHLQFIHSSQHFIFGGREKIEKKAEPFLDSYQF